MDNPGYGGGRAAGEVLQMAVISKTEKQLLHLTENDDVDGVRDLLKVGPYAFGMLWVLEWKNLQ